jgi:hypothetical protein
MNRKLEMDDIRVGMYITVLRGQIEQRTVRGPMGPATTTKEMSHYNGKVLEVTAVDMPYIAVKVYDSRCGRNDSLDLRKIEVMALSYEYIHNLFPDLVLKDDHFFDEVIIENCALEDCSLASGDATIKEIFKGL